MKKLIILFLVVVMALSMCLLVSAGEGEDAQQETDPFLGSWKQEKIYHIPEGEEPRISDYYEPKRVRTLTFIEDGSFHTAYRSKPEANVGYRVVPESKWSKISENEYLLEATETEEMNGATMIYSPELDALCWYPIYQEDELAAYYRAIVGSWQLKEVLLINDGMDPVELSKEENQSLYANDGNILTFNPDKTVSEIVADGADQYETEGTWEMTGPDKYIYRTEGIETEFDYFNEEDVIFRDVQEEYNLRFVYGRVVFESEVEESMEKIESLISKTRS